MGTKAILIGGKLTIQNTLYVAKNGDNATAVRNRMDKPYLTILEATNNALPGDTVYVYPGTYNEGSADITASDVQYWYEDGAHVICNFEVISDFAQPKNIWVDGAGTFETVGVNFGKAPVWTNNALSTIYFRGKELIGRTNGLQLLALDPTIPFDIKVDTITTQLQYGVFLRGNIHGILDFNSINSPPASAIVLSAVGTDLVRREIFINGGTITTQVTGFGGGAIGTFNMFNTLTHYNNITIEHSVGVNGGLIDIWSGFNYFNNCNGTTNIGYGVRTGSGNSVNRFVNCNWVSDHQAFRSLGTTNNEIVGGILQSNDVASLVGTCVLLANTSELDIQGTVIDQLSPNVLHSVIRATNNNLRVSNVKMVGDGISIDSAVAQNISVELPCTTNVPVSINITNVVAGTNIIVDPNVRRNTQTIY